MKMVAITFIIALVIILLALSMLGIGYLLTGKSRLHVGMCGSRPEKNKDGKKGCSPGSCGLCGRTQEEEE